MLLRGLFYVVVFLICLGMSVRVRSARTRQIVLLLASYLLYLRWEHWFFAVLIASTVMNFLLGRMLRRTPSTAILALGIASNLALLSIFKYLPPIAVSLPLASLQRFSHLALPLGISFWTFQAMSYLFDLYREEALDPSFLEFALYMAFFPVTISGPICRMPEMLPQFRSEEPVGKDAVGSGLRRIAIGVLMMQVAKLLGQGILAGDGITSGFDRAAHWSGPDVWCLALGYGLQLFFDFAGYSHIAIGAAQALGFTIPENFTRPFHSTTPSVFWTRWHMSLSFWIRDYVFLPIATLRREVWWRNLSLIISMVIFGLWHKASVLFLLWGCYHGVLLFLHRLVQQFKRNFDREPPAGIWTPISWVVTMALVNLGWIFFRANSLSEAKEMFAVLIEPASYSQHFLSGSLYALIISLAVGYAVVMTTTDALGQSVAEEEPTRASRQTAFFSTMARWRWYWIPPLYALALILVLIVTLSRGVSTAQLMYGNF
jgi:alginate O-acetyltransferase complex protein AlgI